MPFAASDSPGLSEHTRLPLISCVMPTYGRPEYVNESVWMFLAQDYPRKELVILNDCQGQRYQFDHPDVRVVNRETRYPTLGDKRNAVIKMARGDLIAVWDDDDAYLPWRLSFSWREMQKYETPFYRAATFLAYWGTADLHDNESVPGWVNHPNTLFTKALWREVGGYPAQGVGEDAEFFHRIHQHLRKDFIKYPIARDDRFFILRGTSQYAHMSHHGGYRSADTRPGEYIISPRPIEDPVLRTAYHHIVAGRGVPCMSIASNVPVLSVCVSIKNRSRLNYADRELRLFPKAVASLAKAASEFEDKAIELLVADFHSSDWLLRDWIYECAGSLSVEIIGVDGAFSRGRGLNLCAARARGEALFLCDADICVDAATLRRGLDSLIAGSAWFPICQYLDLDDKPAYWQDFGYGLAFVTRTSFRNVGGVPEFTSWGGEDDLFYERVRAFSKTTRERAEGLLHQWHPESSRHDYYQHAAKFDYHHYISRESSSAPIPTKRFVCRHPLWNGELRLYANGRMERPFLDYGSYELSEGVRVVLTWDKWPPEELLWVPQDGVYKALDKDFTLRDADFCTGD